MTTSTRPSYVYYYRLPILEHIGTLFKGRRCTASSKLAIILQRFIWNISIITVDPAIAARLITRQQLFNFRVVNW